MKLAQSFQTESCELNSQSYLAYRISRYQVRGEKIEPKGIKLWKDNTTKLSVSIAYSSRKLKKTNVIKSICI